MADVLKGTTPLTLLPVRPKRYVLALDGVRFLAILIVVLHHTGLGATSSFLPLRLLGSLGKIGGGVPLFFIISGYLITGILLDTRLTEHRYRNFMARRCLRIFPLYFAYLLLTIGLTMLFTGADPHNIWVFVFYLQNMFIQRVDHFDAFLPVYHLWTLGVQEQFYLVWPILIWSCSSLRRVRILCCVILACSILTRVFVSVHLGNFLLAQRIMPSRAGEMCLGALLATERYDETWISRLWPRLMAPLGVLLFVLVIKGTEKSEVGMLFVEEVIALLAACLLATALLPASRTSRILSNPILTRIGGKYSYGLFMFHPAVLLFCEKILHLGHGSAAGIERVAFTLVASLGLAVLSYHFFELPFLALKRYFAPPLIKDSSIPVAA